MSTALTDRPAAGPPAPPSRLREFTALSRTTPGVLSILVVVLVLVSLAVGILSALSVQRRATALENLSTRSGPLSVAAQEIYRSLSDADATATSAFLAGGLEPAPERARYQADIAQAEAALSMAVAARDIHEITAADSPLATLSGQLSVYTGLVETARANNRQGLPVGAAYQREASNLMHTKLLPAAEELFRAEARQVSADQDSAKTWPVVEIVLGLVGLAVLIGAQVFLRRRTNRVFNVGMLVATAAALISLLWVVIATLGVIGNVERSREDGSAQVDVLAQARIVTLNARSNELLTLVARGSGAEYEEEFVALSGELGGGSGDVGLLGRASELATDDQVRDQIESAIAALRAWRAAHEEVRTLDDGGNYDPAVEHAIGAEGDTARVAFDRVDSSLRGAIDTTRQRFADEAVDASSALSGAVAGMILLAVVMAGGVTVGVWQRLKEYR